MTHLRFLFILLALGIFSPWVAQAAPLTNTDVIKMVEADLSEDIIILTIEEAEKNFDLSPGAIIELKKEGVSDPVLKTMLGAPKADSKRAASKDKGEESREFAKDVEIELPPPVDIKVGETYYTRFTIRNDRGRYIATNYGRGIVIPINSEMRVISISKDEMKLQPANGGETFEVQNVPEYSGKTMEGFAAMLLAEEPTSLDALPDDLVTSIKAGEMRLGMNKQQVILARGYPPIHETPTTEVDRWVYWSSRFVKHTVVFNNGILSEGRGLR